MSAKGIYNQYKVQLFIALGMVAVLILLVYTSEIAGLTRSNKKQIKQRDKQISLEKKKVATFADSIKAVDKKIEKLTKEKQAHATKDKLTQDKVHADILSGRDTRSASATQKFLSEYSPAPYDTIN